ncbi:uncharacterized protein [Nicotiana sylvestris]|uniref:uncharacterized protein n=1 Tax=Nicotiana sylvestris TaxID=4096 RepID=UPI00388CC01B
MAEELKKLKSRVQGVECDKGMEGLNYDDLCIQPDVELPEGYKPPKFEIFDGTSDPRVHLRTYCDKLVGVEKDEKIRMKLFMRSLTGDALSWFNTENTPDVFYIQNLKKKPTETFHEYATHWRSEAAKVRQSLDEEQTNKFFFRAQDPQYYERLMATNKALQSGAISMKRDVGAVMVAQGPKSPLTYQTPPPTYQTPPPTCQAPPPTYQPSSPRYSQPATVHHTYNSQPSHFQSPSTSQNFPRPRPNFDRNPPRQYTAIAEPIDQLYERLKATGYVTPILVVALENPSQWVNPNTTYAYHSGMKGHITDECQKLKDKIQTLIDNKVIQAKKVAPNVHNNPLPNHRGGGVPVIETNDEWDL